MPAKKDVKKAIAKGTNPYAVANAMIKKGKLSPAKKEDAVKEITAATLKKKPRGK